MLQIYFGFVLNYGFWVICLKNGIFAAVFRIAYDEVNKTFQKF